MEKLLFPCVMFTLFLPSKNNVRRYQPTAEGWIVMGEILAFPTPPDRSTDDPILRDLTNVASGLLPLGLDLRDCAITDEAKADILKLIADAARLVLEAAQSYVVARDTPG